MSYFEKHPLFKQKLLWLLFGKIGHLFICLLVTLVLNNTQFGQVACFRVQLLILVNSQDMKFGQQKL